MRKKEVYKAIREACEARENLNAGGTTNAIRIAQEQKAMRKFHEVCTPELLAKLIGTEEGCNCFMYCTCEKDK